MTQNLQSWLLAFRPKTLTAALVPILVGTAWVWFSEHQIDVWVPLLAFASAAFIQIGTNLVNDAVDFQKGADHDGRLGPVRVTQKGIFTSRQVMIAATLLFALAIACGLPLVLRGGWPILVIGLVSVALGYGYTAGPFPLAYIGLGDPFVILFFGLVAVGGLVFLLTGQWPREAWLLGLQVGLHATVLIAINNLRDSESDRRVGKMTLPARFGLRFGRWEIAVLAFLPFVLNLLWWPRAGWLVALLPFLSLPLAVKIVKLVFLTDPSPAYNQYLAKGAGLHLLFGALLALGLVVC